MLTVTETITTIKCDKCQKESNAKNDNYNDIFWNQGWVMNKRSRKYHHLCYDCLSKKTTKII